MAQEVRDTVGFEFSRNLAGFPSNATVYKASTGLTLKKGQVALMENGLICSQLSTNSNPKQPANNARGSLVAGVIAADKATTDSDRDVLIYDNPLNVYRVSLAGTTDCVVTSSTDVNAVRLENADGDAITADDDADVPGNLIYIYQGQGKGQMASVLTHATATGITVISGEWKQQPAAGSKCTILAAASTIVWPVSIAPGRFLAHTSTTGLKARCAAAVSGDGVLKVLTVNPEKLTAEVMIAPNKSVIGSGVTAT